MDKYNVDSKSSEETVVFEFLRRVSKGSHVLEFGPAHGRMTKYLKEKRECDVYIVELDEDAFCEAKSFAYDGYCGDIEAFEWTKKIAGKKFDYILFFDVLEHLRSPQSVLEITKDFLSHGGHVLFSVPNIAHADIFMNLYNDTFNYTAVGLLDYTHTHFFAYHSLDEFANSCGYKIVYETCTKIEPFCSEQGAFIPNEKRMELRELILKRSLNEAYQFLCDLQTTNYVNENNIGFVSTFRHRYESELGSQFFFDTGNGFSEEESTRGSIVHFNNSIVQKVTLPSGTKRIRLDPIEGRFCFLYDLEILGSSGYLNYKPLNGYTTLNNSLIFINTDPMVIIENAYQSSFLEVRFKLATFLDFEHVRLLEDFKSQIELNERLNIAIKESQADLELKSVEIREIANKIAIKDKELSEKSSVIVEYDKRNAAIAKINADKDGLIDDQNKTINELISSTSWKVTKPLRRLGQILKPTTSTERTPLDNDNHVANPTEIVQDFPFSYESEYQENENYSEKNISTKAIAFYLPQFHEIPENDQWWGKGFTEWTNTRKAIQHYQNQYEPREPSSEIGYYDLSDVEVLKKQAELAKEHGIFGFCFYLYWFSGKRLLEKPLDILIENSDIDINFCICWANENWTRAWDGKESDILIAQSYSKDDPNRFIDDLEQYISDKRYIRVNGMPVIIVYKPSEIPDFSSVVNQWRDRAKEKGIGELLIWACQTYEQITAEADFLNSIDAEIGFPTYRIERLLKHQKRINDGSSTGLVFDYGELVKREINIMKQRGVENDDKPFFPTITMAWDNSPRRSVNWASFTGFSLDLLYRWTNSMVDYAQKQHASNESFVFINAWNEWGEGTYLEPDHKYGYANINTVSKAICDIPLDGEVKVFSDSKIPVLSVNPKIAVQVHIFYTDLIDEVINYLNNMPYDYDCYISTDTDLKRNTIIDLFHKKCFARKIYTEVFDNRGRDVAPLIEQLQSRINEYKYLCHIHTKKSPHSNALELWRQYQFENLLGSKEYVAALISQFELDDKLGILFPQTYSPVEPYFEWGGNRRNTEAVLHRLGINFPLGLKPMFPAGNMFWARVSAVDALFHAGFTPADFSIENGQKDGTLAHAIERSWVYVARANGFNYLKVLNGYENG